MYAINGLTDMLSSWEDNGWIGIKNAQFFKTAAAILKQRLATTSFKWIKGHNGTQGNEEADKLAKEEAEKPIPDPLDLSIPKEFDLQGAKLATISQATAYKGIIERKPPLSRRTTLTNIQLTRDALAAFNNAQEIDETIWNSLRNTAIRLKIRQLLFKAMHGTQKIGHYWTRGSPTPPKHPLQPQQRYEKIITNTHLGIRSLNLGPPLRESYTRKNTHCLGDPSQMAPSNQRPTHRRQNYSCAYQTRRIIHGLDSLHMGANSVPGQHPPKLTKLDT
jgi:RNase H